MNQISAVAKSTRALAFAVFLAAPFACTIAVAQEEPGPWIPPAGSVAEPSSREFQGVPAPSAETYPPPQGSGGQVPPRLLAPVYRGPEASAPQGPSASAPAFAERPEAGRSHEAGVPSTTQAPFAGSRQAAPPPTALPPARGAVPLPQAEASTVDRKLERGFVSPSAFTADVSAEAAAAPAATGGEPEEKRPLPPKPGPGEALKSSTGKFPYAATFGSLAAVLGAFFVFVWFQKRGSKRGVGALPPEVVEPLGTIPFVSRQALHVVRFGSKILLVNVTIGGSETLAEIDDPREAERILALCRRNRSDSLGRTFREVLGTPRPGAGSSSNDRSRGAAHA